MDVVGVGSFFNEVFVIGDAVITDISQHDNPVLCLLAGRVLLYPIFQHLVGMYETIDNGSSSSCCNFVQPFKYFRS